MVSSALAAETRIWDIWDICSKHNLQIHCSTYNYLTDHKMHGTQWVCQDKKVLQNKVTCKVHVMKFKLQYWNGLASVLYNKWLQIKTDPSTTHSIIQQYSGSGPPPNTSFFGPSESPSPNGTPIGLAVFAGLTAVTNIHRDHAHL